MHTVTSDASNREAGSFTLTDAVNTLAQVGVASEHGIRDLLQRESITGALGEASSCPVGRWIERVTGADTVRVDTYMIEAWYERDGAPAECDSAFTPAVVSEHLDNFDSGLYPELVA